MTKSTTVFICSNCDAQYQKWVGRCLECGKWGTVEQQTINNEQLTKTNLQYPSTKTVSLSEIHGKELYRIKTNIGELDRVLGGGIVPGSLILLGGEPGIGKSTLAMQLALAIPKTIYISGEESVEQIKMRVDRIVETRHASSLQLANETNVEKTIATIHEQKPNLTIIDSVQTLYSEEVAGETGNLNQIRVCTTKLLEAAKNSKTAILLIGHVTKDGLVAGPKTLEHLVDTVFYFEGDHFQNYRILRSVKNRFGGTDEVGIFEMAEDGLREVKNPSANVLSLRADELPGSVITCLIEGTRPLLVEIQALVNKTAFGYPARKASGFDINRLHLLIAVLQKRASLNLSQYDIHLNVVGGLEAREPAADLAVCLAIASSYKNKALGKNLVMFGEVGLGGEIRPVRSTEKRLKESEQLGMKRIILGQVNGEEIKDRPGLKIIAVKNIAEIIKQT